MRNWTKSREDEKFDFEMEKKNRIDNLRKTTQSNADSTGTFYLCDVNHWHI